MRSTLSPWTLAVGALIVARTALSQCENNGTRTGASSQCSCPPGFGGPTCSQPACGGDIFMGTNRPLVDGSATSFSNLTAATCPCETDWAGIGCNICQTSNACQKAFARVSNSSNTISSSQLGGNETLVCNAQPRVYASGQMSCSVANPSIQGIFPGSTSLNILRTIQPNSTPLANVTSFGPAGSVYTQLWYNGVEQFYCAATSCEQSIGSDNSTTWTCQNLGCQCRQNTTFCGSGPLNIASIVNVLSGTLTISCGQTTSNGSGSCTFQQDFLDKTFGNSGLQLTGCTFGECVAQGVIDTASGLVSPTTDNHKNLSGGVIAGLAVVGALLLVALLSLAFGLVKQRHAKKGYNKDFFNSEGVPITWSDVSYVVGGSRRNGLRPRRREGLGYTDDKVILDNVSGNVTPGQMMAILGPSGAGKTTLVEILAGKQKIGRVSGKLLSNPSSRIAFVPQQDVLPAMLTVREALLFAAALRLPESVTKADRSARVDAVIEQLGLQRVVGTRIGSAGHRGISGGEMRRVSIGLELVGRPDALILDEPTSGLDAVSAARVADVLRSVAHDPTHPIAVIASIHQPSSKLYHTFDSVMVLAHGRALYSGPGGLRPAEYFVEQGVPAPPEGHNVAEYLLDIASEPRPDLFNSAVAARSTSSAALSNSVGARALDAEKSEIENTSVGKPAEIDEGVALFRQPSTTDEKNELRNALGLGGSRYATTFLTQFEVLAGREWKTLRRDLTLFLTHVGVACVLGVFVGGLYYKTGDSIAGFQSRVGCLFFLGALIAFSTLSALYNVVETKQLFLRERSNNYYSPTAWLLSRLVFDVVPLRLIPTIIVSTETYWMAGLSHDAAHFFKFLFILVLYTLAMTLFNFLLACAIPNGGVAILLSALTALYQMTFAGFFVHLNSIPPVLRWLQWLCPLKFTLEALSVNEVGSGLQIIDTIQGVPVSISASVIMQMLFGFGLNNYYRDILVLFAFIAGFGLAVIGIVWMRMSELR